jgi:hypothetical protein
VPLAALIKYLLVRRFRQVYEQVIRILLDQSVEIPSGHMSIGLTRNKESLLVRHPPQRICCQFHRFGEVFGIRPTALSEVGENRRLRLRRMFFGQALNNSL